MGSNAIGVRVTTASGQELEFRGGCIVPRGRRSYRHTLSDRLFIFQLPGNSRARVHFAKREFTFKLSAL